MQTPSNPRELADAMRARYVYGTREDADVKTIRVGYASTALAFDILREKASALMDAVEAEDTPPGSPAMLAAFEDLAEVLDRLDEPDRDAQSDLDAALAEAGVCSVCDCPCGCGNPGVCSDCRKMAERMA